MFARHAKCFRWHTLAGMVVALMSAALAGCASNVTPVELYGMPAPAAAAERTIVITPQTRYVNVEGGQIVRFLVGGKEFTWNFFIGRKSDAFDLNEVAPPGILTHRVRAYVSPDPRYINGPDRVR